MVETLHWFAGYAPPTKPSLVLLIMVLVFNVAARVAGRALTKHFTGRTS